MRIAMLHADLPGTTRGGVAHQVSRLSDALVDRGHDVVAVSFSPRPPGVSYRVDVIGAPRIVSATKLGWLVGSPIAFAARSWSGFDVVHAHGDSYLLFRRRIPIVRTFYGSAREEARHAERLRRKIAQRGLVSGERIARRAATVTVGISENTRASVGQLDAIIPCGVDCRRFRPGPKSARPSVLFVGTLRGRKRGHLVVEAFRRSVRPRMPECELWMVADEPVGGAGVRSFGLVDDDTLAGLYRRAWLFTLPSTYEGFGVPYLEAMASGTAVVATANPGATELLGPASGGIVIEDAMFGEAILSLLQDSRRRRELERRGRRGSARFDWEHIAARYEEVYALARARASAVPRGKVWHSFEI